MNLTRRPGIRPQEKVRNAFRIGHPVRVRKASAEPAPPDARTSHGRVFSPAGRSDPLAGLGTRVQRRAPATPAAWNHAHPTAGVYVLEAPPV